MAENPTGRAVRQPPRVIWYHSIAVLSTPRMPTVAAVVVAAAVDAAAHVQVDGAQVEQFVQVLVALGDGCRNGQRAGVGQRAEVAAGAGNHVGQQADVGLGQTQRACGFVQCGQVAFKRRAASGSGRGYARLASAELLGQLGQGVQRVGACVAWGKTRA